MLDKFDDFIAGAAIFFFTAWLSLLSLIGRGVMSDKKALERRVAKMDKTLTQVCGIAKGAMTRTEFLEAQAIMIKELNGFTVDAMRERSDELSRVHDRIDEVRADTNSHFEKILEIMQNDK